MSTKNLIIQQSNIAFDPFSLYKRQTDIESFKNIRYPVNPLIC